MWQVDEGTAISVQARAGDGVVGVRRRHRAEQMNRPLTRCGAGQVGDRGDGSDNSSLRTPALDTGLTMRQGTLRWSGGLGHILSSGLKIRGTWVALSPRCL